jgi:hypothetical protein
MIGVLRTTARVLFFRASRAELLALDHRHLAFGLACTWLVGIGRYWDDPRAHLIQHLGLGSVIYVFALSLFLWLLLWPLAPNDWSWRRLLVFVTLVAPPAALYAIPVERFVSLDAACVLNGWFLAIVAAWRVALLFRFLRLVAGFQAGRLVVAGLLPLTVIVFGLTALNLQHVAFDLMGGFRDPSPDAGAYHVLCTLSIIGSLALIPLLIAYLWLIVLAQRERQRLHLAGSLTSARRARRPRP